ncbi:hypothetical protein [Arthrobacter sp. CAN_C5]|uniref:hypothetical protein n=1 Tax=Arthrobacter sp. CAN_C5 TaxID=2760706 RepID=UPI001AE69EA3|nr:hypothetical protein [Arthrobacter sp. CAN_C5]MBP2215817.1 hypothetical protein [Arthrobacter sp. CAN_C5]
MFRPTGRRTDKQSSRSNHDSERVRDDRDPSRAEPSCADHSVGLSYLTSSIAFYCPRKRARDCGTNAHGTS